MVEVLVARVDLGVDPEAEAPVVETDRSQLAETVQQAEVQNLPFEGRNYLDMGVLLPGVSPTNTASTQTLAETSEVVGQGYSVNSQRNFFSSNCRRSILAPFAAWGSSLRGTVSLLAFSSPINGGLIVNASQPASSRISPLLRKLAPITSVV